MNEDQLRLWKKISYVYPASITINVCSQNEIERDFKLEEFNTSIRSIEQMEEEANLIKSYINEKFSS
ncbi:hypothetical protein PFHG_05631 [Plasmodium falciparum HB3]|uniref:Uncharacterized protein n=1 Tax=Plasmodium falciparum (isolate HB3) TaxID=137071 RepID=A0A0L7K5G0_PLAFX|nr:hypothetical protein PFHG_05631 [Plasmodium falciparum HB3]